MILKYFNRRYLSYPFDKRGNPIDTKKLLDQISHRLPLGKVRDTNFRKVPEFLKVYVLVNDE